MKTRITELLGIRYPVIQGGLQGLGRAELAAAVSAAGGLGLVTAGCFETPAELEAEIVRARRLTDRPVGVNISIGSRRSMSEFVDCICELGVKIVFTSGHNPEAFVERIKRHGMKWVHVAPAVHFALKAQQLGADGVVLVGFEAGGHPGMDDVALSVLVRKASVELEIPVIAAGGISDGRSMVAALAWGAEGVQIGTRFVLTRESVLHPDMKQALLQASQHDTVMIERTLRRARRVLRTPQAEAVLALEREGAGFDQLRHIIGGEAYLETILEGRMDRGVLSTGQAIGLLDDVPTAGDVVRRIVDESAWVLERLNRIASA
ncbi:NAD(P)H-dependent flavin oxidoreductase [Simplicispira suum]|uniref:Nitronate monooxygenase n=1 Tax=Simplicispira suum TaxID=2109915 RepID=A0A2S0MYN1_9BURK|nr:nitronate monooxygenase family protein [Simplicispira suum]AVO41008.1 nitronate monooxygenase [Simplicispira suum]